MRHQVHILLAEAVPADPEDVGGWPRYRELLPHLLGAGEANSHADIRALVLRTVCYLRVSGDPRLALEVAEPALRAWRNLSHTPDDYIRPAEAEYTAVLRELGRFREAGRTAGLPASSEQARAPGAFSLATAHGAWLRFTGDFSAALAWDRLVQQSAASAEHHLHLHLASVNVALDQVLLGEFSSAGWTLLAALDALQAIDSARLHELGAEIDMAHLLRLRGDAEQAYACSSQAFARCRNLLGPRHPLTQRAIRERTIADAA